MDSIDLSLPLLPILLDEVMCNGSERALTQCAHDDFNTHDCGHRENVAVQCLRKLLATLDKFPIADISEPSDSSTYLFSSSFFTLQPYMGEMVRLTFIREHFNSDAQVCLQNVYACDSLHWYLLSYR